MSVAFVRIPERPGARKRDSIDKLFEFRVRCSESGRFAVVVASKLIGPLGPNEFYPKSDHLNLRRVSGPTKFFKKIEFLPAAVWSEPCGSSY